MVFVPSYVVDKIVVVFQVSGNSHLNKLRYIKRYYLSVP